MEESLIEDNSLLENDNLLNDSSDDFIKEDTVISKDKDKDETINIIEEVIYNGEKCKVVKQNNDELLLEFQIKDYLTGKLMLVKQWVKNKAITYI